MEARGVGSGEHDGRNDHLRGNGACSSPEMSKTQEGCVWILGSLVLVGAFLFLENYSSKKERQADTAVERRKS